MSNQDQADTETFGKWLAQFLPGSQTYRSNDGHVVMILNMSSASAPEAMLGNRVFLHDGLLAEGYQQLDVVGYGRAKSGTNWTCDHPDGRRFIVLQEEDVVTILETKNGNERVPHDGWKHYRLVPENERGSLPTKTFLPLPHVRVPRYLFLHPDGRAFYVNSLKYNDGRPNQLRCFVGWPGAMVKMEVLDVLRAKDGGTTLVFTSAGTLFSPPPGESGKSFYYPCSEPFDEDKIRVDVLRRGALPGAVEIRQIPCLENEAFRALMAWLFPA